MKVLVHLAFLSEIAFVLRAVDLSGKFNVKNKVNAPRWEQGEPVGAQVRIISGFSVPGA